MQPFVIKRVWDAGRPVAFAERGSTLALLLAAVQRITAAAISPAGCPWSRCSSPIRRTANLRCVTVAVAHSHVGRGIMLALLTLASCTHAETWTSYRLDPTAYSQADSGWQGQSYRLGAKYGEFQGPRSQQQRCPEYTMGTQTQRECWP
jgi:hypothetical protein